MNKFPKKKIRIMLHALGISNLNDGNYIQPNEKYSTYPTSYRNHYQISDCPDWNYLVEKGYAKFKKGAEDFWDFYYVTKEGKQFLQDLGYKWQESK